MVSCSIYVVSSYCWVIGGADYDVGGYSRNIYRRKVPIYFREEA